MNRSVNKVVVVVTMMHIAIHNVITTNGILLGFSSWNVDRFVIVWLLLENNPHSASSWKEIKLN